MSIDTWIDEFYPQPACIVKPENAIQHSLVKWIGLRPENLAKHGCAPRNRNSKLGFRAMMVDTNGDTFLVNSSSCALCQTYRDPDDNSPWGCEKCPLTPLSELQSDSDGCEAEYEAWLNDEANPEPMIKLLEAALAKQQAK